MAKLFSVKLANLENEMKDLKLNTPSTTSITKIQDLATQQAALMVRVSDTEKRVDELDTKINQMVDELSTILNQHATAIKDLTNIIRQQDAATGLCPSGKK